MTGSASATSKWEVLENMCPTISGVVRTPPISVHNPSSTGRDEPPSDNQESAQSLGAPQGPQSKSSMDLSALSRDPGTSDGSPLISQYYNR